MAIGSKTDVSNNIHNKTKYHSENEEDKNTKVTHGKAKERFQCPRCEKHFGHQQILQLHLRVHESNGDAQLKSSHKGKEDVKHETKNDGQLNKFSCMLTNNERLQSSTPSKNSHLLLAKPSSPQHVNWHYTLLHFNKKFIGLTKIRLEDCMRCDACSCIYLDESDYNKHMKNFHRQDSPKKNRQKKGCRSCCKHCNCRGDHQHHNLQKDRGNNNLFHYNIKDRWSKMVSRRLSPEELRQDIKADPDLDTNDPAGTLDYSHLLSQVEVKIKIEPPEYEENLGLSG